jgi:hypothetical protein
LDVYMEAGTGCNDGKKLGHNVVVCLVKQLDHRGHVVLVDNFFTLVSLFHELLCRRF